MAFREACRYMALGADQPGHLSPATGRTTGDPRSDGSLGGGLTGGHRVGSFVQGYVRVSAGVGMHACSFVHVVSLGQVAKPRQDTKKKSCRLLASGQGMLRCRTEQSQAVAGSSRDIHSMHRGAQEAEIIFGAGQRARASRKYLLRRSCCRKNRGCCGGACIGPRSV